MIFTNILMINTNKSILRSHHRGSSRKKNTHTQTKHSISDIVIFHTASGYEVINRKYSQIPFTGYILFQTRFL